MNKDVAIGRITECVEAINASLQSDEIDLKAVLESLVPALMSIAANLQELDDRQQVMESSIEDLEFE